MNSAVESVTPSIVKTENGLNTTLRPMDSLIEEGVLEQLQNAIEAALEADEIRVILDLAGVPILNSAALEAFLEHQDRLIEAGGWFKLSHAGTVVRDILRITDLDKFVSIVGEDLVIDATRRVSTASTERIRLGDIFLESKLLTQTQITEALKLQEKSGSDLVASLSLKVG